MAEKRFISRRITESDRIRQLANDGKLLATTLYAFFLPFLDKAGRMNANPLLLKGGMFEGYDWTVEQLDDAVRDLARVGLIRLYSNGKFGHLIQYEKFLTADGGFNKPHDKEPDSDLPGPEDTGSAPVVVQDAIPKRTGSERNTAPPRTEPVRESSRTPPGDDPAYIEVKRDIEIEREPRARTREAGAGKDEKKGRPKKSRDPDFDPLKAQLPEFVSPDVWRDFADHRREINKPLTERAAKLTLEDLAKHPTDADEMLRTSIKRGWTGVFPLDKARDGARTGPAATAWDHILDAARKGKPPQDLDKAAAAALKAVGGWSAVAYCPEPYLAQRRAKFLDAYDTKPKRGSKAA